MLSYIDPIPDGIGSVENTRTFSSRWNSAPILSTGAVDSAYHFQYIYDASIIRQDFGGCNKSHHYQLFSSSDHVRAMD